jgi:hypothetical protein
MAKLRLFPVVFPVSHASDFAAAMAHDGTESVAQPQTPRHRFRDE